MNTKLTLNIEKAVVERAKRYAKTRHRSVSSLVQDYLNALSRPEEYTTPKEAGIAPLVAELSEIFKGVNFPEGDAKTLLDESRDERFQRKG